MSRQGRHQRISLGLGIVALFLAGCGSAISVSSPDPSSTPQPLISILTPALPITPTIKIPSPTSSANQVIPANSYASSPTPDGWFAGIDSFLPLECNERDKISSAFLDRFRFTIGRCKLLSISPDGSYIAYVLAENVSEAGSNPRFSQVVKTIQVGKSTPDEAYHLELYTIFSLVWKANNRLVIVDSPIEGQFGYTVIYDPGEERILQTVYGRAWDYNWNPQRTAFYTILGDNDYGPECRNFLSGYDFVHDRVLPDLVFSGDIKYFKVVGSPAWTSSGLQLWVVVRLGQGETATLDSVYGPASVVAIDISGKVPKQVTLYSDPNLDFSLDILPDGSFQVSSLPYSSTTCLCFESPCE